MPIPAAITTAITTIIPKASALKNIVDQVKDNHVKMSDLSRQLANLIMISDKMSRLPPINGESTNLLEGSLAQLQETIDFCLTKARKYSDKMIFKKMFGAAEYAQIFGRLQTELEHMDAILNLAMHFRTDDHISKVKDDLKAMKEQLAELTNEVKGIKAVISPPSTASSKFVGGEDVELKGEITQGNAAVFKGRGTSSFSRDSASGDQHITRDLTSVVELNQAQLFGMIEGLKNDVLDIKEAMSHPSSPLLDLAQIKLEHSKLLEQNLMMLKRSASIIEQNSELLAVNVKILKLLQNPPMLSSEVSSPKITEPPHRHPPSLFRSLPLEAQRIKTQPLQPVKATSGSSVCL